MSKKITGLLYAVLYVAAYFIAQIIAIIALPLSDTVLRAINGERDFARLYDYFINRVSGSNRDTVYVLLAAMAITLAIVWLILQTRKIKLSKLIKKRALHVREIVAAVLFAYGLNVAAVYITSLPVLARFQGSYTQAMDSLAFGELPIMLIVVGFIAPAFEELLYRGIIFGELRRSGGFLFANIFQSIIFGVMHMNVIQGIYAAIIGFALGGMYQVSGTLYITILTHILFNASNIFFAGWIGTFAAMPYFIVSGAVSLFLGFLLITKR